MPNSWRPEPTSAGVAPGNLTTAVVLAGTVTSTVSLPSARRQETSARPYGVRCAVLAQAKDKVQEWGAVAADKAGEAAQDLGREMTNLVRRYPIQAMVAGLAVGLLLARVTSRR